MKRETYAVRRSYVPLVGDTLAARASPQSAIIQGVDYDQPILLLLRNPLEDERYPMRIGRDGARTDARAGRET